jgi:hypothetical protein
LGGCVAVLGEEGDDVPAGFEVPVTSRELEGLDDPAETVVGFGR